MLTPKICVECQAVYTPRCRSGTEEYAKQKFCGKPCHLKFRKRLRHKKPIPEAVAAQCVQQGVRMSTPEYDTISFRNLHARS